MHSRQSIGMLWYRRHIIGIAGIVWNSRHTSIVQVALEVGIIWNSRHSMAYR